MSQIPDIRSPATELHALVRQIYQACSMSELEFLQHEEYTRDGIPLNRVTLADLATTAFDWPQPA